MQERAGYPFLSLKIFLIKSDQIAQSDERSVWCEVVSIVQRLSFRKRDAAVFEMDFLRNTL